MEQSLSAGCSGGFCRVAANAAAFPGGKGMRAQFMSCRKFHKQNANSQFQALFGNIFLFPAAARS